ncbi:MAG: VCBS repeat-containing protein [FCB group bacterium]|nr:VCBS repeat-containing protein [FCB group bacterium]MBL7027988.1 VCBS repeat-containing protein [Candidatus Neomarinimicrobiota bacterium]
MFQQNNPTAFTSIHYHMSWPGSDPFYTYSSADGNARRAHYGFSWVPYFVVDGGDHATLNETQDVSVWGAAIMDQAALTSPLSISATGDMNYQGEGFIDITLSPEAGVDGDYTLQVVLVEDGIYFMGSNGYPHHEAVMRHIFPSPAGTPINMVAGIDITETINLQIPQDFVVANCRLVVFVEASDQSVLNTATFDVVELTPINVPYIQVLSTNIDLFDDNADNKLNPGESANYYVTIDNNCGWVEATGITGYLSSTNPLISISDSVGVFSSLSPCSTTSNEIDKFTFTVSSEAPRVSEFEFNLRILANQDSETPYETNETITVTIDMFQNHFPIDYESGIVSGNAVLDLDGDGSQEVIFGGTDSLLHVITVAGLELSGFPFVSNGKITSAPAIGDVDNDGDLEIVFTTLGGSIYVVESDGSGELVAQAAGLVLGTPAIDDLDNDGDLEIVTTGFDYDITAIHHDGSALSGFPLILDGERMEGGAAIADLNGDGFNDIIVGTTGDFIHAYDASGNSLTGFPVNLSADIKTAPVVTDLTGNGNLEIIAGQLGGMIYALSSTGTELWNHQLVAIPVLTGHSVFDYNRDGLMETVYILPDGRVSVLDHDGNMLEGWPQTLATTCYSQPIIADIDGDDVPEIILGDDSDNLYAFHIDGTLLPNFPMLQGDRVHSAATVADLDLDGNLEIVVGTDAGLSVVDMPAISEAGPFWYTSRGNYQRTGYFPNPIASSSSQSILPDILTLKQNYPNPFNPSTTIEFGIPTSSVTDLTIFDLLGNQVTRLIDKNLSAGHYSLVWSGLDHAGNQVAAGVYFARIQAGGEEQLIKMMLLK